MDERLKAVSKKIIAVLRDAEMTVADVREVLRYIDETIEYNAVVK